MNAVEIQDMLRLVQKRGYKAAQVAYNINHNAVKRIANKYGVESPVRTTSHKVLNYLKYAEEQKTSSQQIINDLREILK